VRSSGQDFLFYLTLLVSFVLFNLGETEWLRRRTKAGTASLLFVAFTSNILSLILSNVFSYVIFLIGVIAFDAREIPALSALIFFGGIIAVTGPPLAIIKLLLLKLAKVKGLTRPWIYAAVTAILFQLTVMGLMILLVYFV